MKLKVVRCFVSLLIVGHAFPTFSQPKETGNWIMYFGTNTISDNFSLHTEIQYRNHTIAPVNIEQLLLRTGLNYHFSNKAFVTVGYGYIEGYQFESKQKAPESIEHRIWQQFILKNELGRVKFEHRYRVEQRWITEEFRNRFRYRVMLFVPLNDTEIERGTVFIGLYDEVFLNDRRDLFDRNRLYGALGYQIDSNIGIQVGGLRQVLNDFAKWYLQVAITFNTDFRNSTQ